ncbi:helix-turn-helix domain-containing protein [Uruburuella testudinis]|uniref:Helix-turn-helix domain-containing protein n=1 Tax=Uruburuella testudinis TaxID=1282863 RepID=A0ABY4DTW2_9NEIS|nr:helix-turn-helix transcriptional regulator [Uruburuella testudinis]UOO82313.1 helix-turn-helix domain-containing protein [Uruburuella testudinis]
MHSNQDKSEFSKRLRFALESAGMAALSTADLANRFNLRHPNNSVTPQAVHNWLIGQSIPTADKIDTLAKWLDTTPEWLRHGRMMHDGEVLTQEELLLLELFRNLSPSRQKALLALLHEFR